MPRSFLLPTRAITAVLLTMSVGAGVAAAQSLGELAKQEEARRKAIKDSGKVYTNDNVRSAPAPAPRTESTTSGSPASAPPAAAPSPSGVQPPSPSGVQPPSPSGAQPAAAGQQPAAGEAAGQDQKKDEKYWRQRIQSERDALSRAQTFAEALQSRINALSTDFVNRDDPAQRAVIGNDRQKALAELDRVKREIEQHTKGIAAIQEEARRASVPPGWVGSPGTELEFAL